MRAVIIIPSRLASTRLPEKALKKICGISLIEHVYKRACMSKLADKVYVATDSVEIAELISKCDGNVIMTSSDHSNGTERISEAAKSIDAEYVINVQGDEALVNPSYIDKCLSGLLADSEAQAAILVNKFYKKNSSSDIKVVFDSKSRVMYFSRSDIPSFDRVQFDHFFKAYHVVAFKKDFLLKYPSLSVPRLEIIESNEYIRILSHGYTIKSIEVESSAVSVDTEEDFLYVKSIMPSDPFYKLYS